MSGSHDKTAVWMRNSCWLLSLSQWLVVRQGSLTGSEEATVASPGFSKASPQKLQSTQARSRQPCQMFIPEARADRINGSHDSFPQAREIVHLDVAIQAAAINCLALVHAIKPIYHFIFYKCFLILYCSRVDSQCCVSFRCTVK